MLSMHSNAPLATEPPTLSSSRWSFWPNWQLSYPDLGSISPATTGCWHRIQNTQSTSWGRLYRKLVVPRRRTKTKRKHTTHPAPPLVETEHPLPPLSWAERLKRVFKIDITQCPRCGGKLRVIPKIRLRDQLLTSCDFVYAPLASLLHPAHFQRYPAR